MKRAILLQTDAPESKKGKLRSALSTAASEFNRLRDERDHCARFMDFHRKVYSSCKKRTSFNSQVVCDIERSVWRSKGRIRGITLKFNVPRNCKVFDKSVPFVKFSLFSKDPVPIPIVRNRNFQRYSDLLRSGWTCKTYGLTSRLGVVAYLSKDEAVPTPKRNMLGIDFNAKRIAITILSDTNRVLYQAYFGLHIWTKRRKIMARRSVMQAFGNLSALRRLKTREFNFVDTNLGQMIREITDLALRYDADISIENLKRFRPKSRKFNRIVMRTPFFKFKEILASRCLDKNITLNIVDSWHTSKFCSRCGAVGKGHDSRNYALFRCRECGVVVNSDRNASRNAALKCLLERNDALNRVLFQVSSRGGLVNGPGKMSDEVGLPNVAVQHAYQLMESHAL
jgi:IS605 OrfB family transposase